ncbi:uncharacterized protein JN550_013777 [Neoarthrinium moseri]|uniref:uncharacterized protein n=1 Tax=Neoarthrinium moseri TaxID=1658444 RepID=UPI001FDE4EE4|nr:uncharacterized protein JN550_013777 [Neoarthrinium moseri]KAI1856494.1 hypothetical protein JN550_013777 [Neoarthrinium moseri]
MQTQYETLEETIMHEGDMSSCEENDVVDDRDLDILRGACRASHCSGSVSDVGPGDSEHALAPDGANSSKRLNLQRSSPQSTVDLEQPDHTVYRADHQAFSSIATSPAAMSIDSVDGPGPSQRITHNDDLEMFYSRPSEPEPCNPGSCNLANHALRPDHRKYGRIEGSNSSNMSSLPQNMESKTALQFGPCRACGCDMGRLLQLTERISQFDLPGDIPWEAHLANAAVLPAHQKAAAMRKISQWALRDYAIKSMFPSLGALDKDRREAAISSERTARLRGGSTQEMTFVTPHQHDTVPGDKHLNMNLLGFRSRDHQTWAGSPVRPRERLRGQLRKPWTDSDERHLRLSVRRKIGWAQIAQQLNRTPGAVEQHWRLINHDNKTRRRVPKAWIAVRVWWMVSR